MLRRPEEVGRINQRVPWLSGRGFAVIVLCGAVLTLLLCWHLAMVLVGGIPVAGVGVTLQALMALDPTDVPVKYSRDIDGLMAFVVFLLLLLLVAGAATWLVFWRHKRTRAKGGHGLATKQQVRKSVGEQKAREKAKFGRKASVEAGLDVQACPLSEVGFHLGNKHDDHEPVILTLEDQVGVVAATGMGKTLYLMQRAALDAPGALVVTSTRPELLDALIEARTAVGTVHVWDPLNVSHWPVPMVWNPVAGCKDPAVASSRGIAFSGGISSSTGGDATFFHTASANIMARLLRGAAMNGDLMDKVILWAADLKTSAKAAVTILNRPGNDPLWGSTLETAITGSDETISGVRMTMGQKIEPLLNPVVLRQLIPQPDVRTFDPRAFVTSTDTLIIITDDQATTNVAPLATMLLNEVIDCAKAVAAVSEYGRLDPPMRIVGDELANVAPLPKLPGMLSDSRGNGVQWFAAFQSVAQILARWGEEEGRVILANLNVSVVLGGLQDEKALERFSALVGSVDTQQVTSSVDSGNTTTARNITLEERTAIRPEEIRHLPDGQALVIHRNSHAMIVDMIPWFDREDGDEIAEAMKRIRKIRLAEYQATC